TPGGPPPHRSAGTRAAQSEGPTSGRVQAVPGDDVRRDREGAARRGGARCTAGRASAVRLYGRAHRRGSQRSFLRSGTLHHGTAEERMARLLLRLPARRIGRARAAARGGRLQQGDGARRGPARLEGEKLSDAYRREAVTELRRREGAKRSGRRS